MYCSNCGAEISPNDARCPYCGMLNPDGAEKEYMEKLETIRDKTASLNDIPESEVKSELKKSGRLIAIIILAVGAAFAALALCALLLSSRSEREWEARQKEEIAFERKYFAELNELYEAGDDAAVDAFINEHINEKGASALYDWLHCDYYINYYAPYRQFETARDTLGTFIGNERFDDQVTALAACLSAAFELLYVNDSRDYITVPPGRDSERVAGMKAEARSFLADKWGLSENEQETLYHSCTDKDGYVSVKLCREAAESLLKGESV